MIRVKYSGQLRTLVGKSEEELEVHTVSALLAVIKQRYGQKAYKAAKSSHIVVNGENAGLHGGFKMKLADGMVVHLVPVCGGG